jgi:tellurite methyltransferase
MPHSQSEWDAKHKLAAEVPASEPASIVRELLPLLPSGPALDIACGTGRHTLFLAARGQHVTAVDYSRVALDILEVRAHSQQLTLKRGDRFRAAGRHAHGGIELVQTNLEETQLPEHCYDLILCVQYLQRTLFPQIVRALRPEGVFLMETFTQAQMEFSGGPRNPAYLLGIGELRDAFPALSILFYRELRAGVGIASLVAKKRAKGS